MSKARAIEHDFRLAQQVVGRMKAEGAAIASDEEIERTLSGCVGGTPLVAAAKQLREQGTIRSDLTVAMRHVITCGCGFRSVFLTKPPAAACASCGALIAGAA